MKPGQIGLRYGPHIAVFTVGYVVFSYAAVPGAVMAEFDVGFTAVGLLMSAALGAFTVVQVIGGRLVNDRPTAPVLLGLVVIHALLALALDLAGSYASLLALRFAWGLAGGLTVTIGATQISRVYDGEWATRHESFYGGALTLGGAVAFLITPHVVAITGWVGIHAIGGLLAIPVAVLLFVGRDSASMTEARTVTTESTPAGESDRDESPPGGGQRDGHLTDNGDRDEFHTEDDDPEDRPAVDEYRSSSLGRSDDATGSSPFTNRLVLLAALCYVATLGAYVTLSTFVTAFFDDLGVVAPLNAVALLAASLGRVSGGFAIVRPGVDDGRLIAVATAIGTAGLLGLAVGEGLALLVLPLLALAAVSVPFGAIFKTAAVASYRDASALAIVVAAGNFAALVLPAVTGRIRDATGGYELAFFLLAGLNSIAILAGVAITRRR